MKYLDVNINPTMSITILDINGLKKSSQKLETVRLYKKQDPTTCCQQKTYFRFKDTNRLTEKKCHMQTGTIRKLGWLY